MDWNDAISWLAGIWESFGAWLASDRGKDVADWLVALGTTGAVLFAVWSTLYERKHRLIMQDVELMRALDLALKKRSKLADQISFRITTSYASRSLASRVLRRRSHCHSIVVANPSPYPIHKVALIHEPQIVTGNKENDFALYVSDPFWSVPAIPAGMSEALEVSHTVLGDPARTLLRFETPNATCWAKSEDGRSRLLGDSSLLGVTSEKIYAARVRGSDQQAKARRKRKALVAYSTHIRRSRKSRLPHDPPPRGLTRLLDWLQGQKD